VLEPTGGWGTNAPAGLEAEIAACIQLGIANIDPGITGDPDSIPTSAPRELVSPERAWVGGRTLPAFSVQEVLQGLPAPGSRPGAPFS
jgi:hypothetical protein